MMINIPSKEVLIGVVKDLQPLMGIQDWDIDIDKISVNEMTIKHEGDNKLLGDVTIKLTRNTARILIVDADTDEWYDTVVHELVHVQLYQFEHCIRAYMEKDYSYLGEISEQYVDKLTRMIVKMHPCKEVDYYERKATGSIL